MRKFLLSFGVVVCFVISAVGQETYTTRYEQSNGEETATYEEIIAYFQRLDQDFSDITMVTRGITDSGHPLHVVMFDPARDFDPAVWGSKGRTVLFINNGIHPGEPDGIDASMLWMRDLALGKTKLPEGLVVALIPVYNIGGHLNRGSYSRVNQQGPREYGFRGNAQNYDLNRDFIKADSRNAQSFQEIFHWLSPHVFIDTHVSNGADYQHVMTLISTQHDRLGGVLGAFLEEEFEPHLYLQMGERGFPLVPYVNAWQGKPEDGWPQFMDTGRYSSGYAATFGTLSFMPETHMLKPYPERVSATYSLFESFVQVIGGRGEKVRQIVEAHREAMGQVVEVYLNFQLDTASFKEIDYLGFRSGYKPSEVSGHPRLYYDRALPFSAKVNLKNRYTPGLTIKVPTAYVIPQGWHRVIKNLIRNGIEVQRLESDTTLQATIYRIVDLETSRVPYEGHYIHRQVEVECHSESVALRKGDFMVLTAQKGRRYLVETLEPQGEDSFFAWNFFDTILQSKEGYSAYVFEDLAAAFLQENPDIRRELERQKLENESFAADGAAQLRWVYERSPWKEKEHNRYPIYRIE